MKQLKTWAVLGWADNFFDYPSTMGCLQVNIFSDPTNVRIRVLRRLRKKPRVARSFADDSKNQEQICEWAYRAVVVPCYHQGLNFSDHIFF